MLRGVSRRHVDQRALMPDCEQRIRVIDHEKRHYILCRIAFSRFAFCRNR